MGNLLSLNTTFNWVDNQVDRGPYIEALNDALALARDFKDEIFRCPGFEDIQIAGHNFLDFIYAYSFDDDLRKNICPWLTQVQHQALIEIAQIFQNTTARPSSTLEELNEEFPGCNNSLVGLFNDGINAEYVYDCDTWQSYHRAYVATFDRRRRENEFDYFEKFYIPTLNIHPNEINTLIKRGQVNSIFERLDMPKQVTNGINLHGEQIQMHFNDSKMSALNIDGTWKHGGFKIPNDAKDQLVQWGFVLPPG